MQISARRGRPMHVGPDPMGKIKRADQPAILIIEEEAKRMPKRADRFEIAYYRDFGGKAAAR